MKEEGVDSLSKEEKTRLAMKGELLQLVHETELYKHVSEWLASAICCCKGVSSPCENQTLNEIAAKVCSQGAELLAGRMGGPVGSFCCKEICVQCLKTNGGSPKTLVSGTVTAGKNEQGVEVLVPESRKNPERTNGCIVRHPASNDVLTVLLLALPPHIWSGIKDKNFLDGFLELVLTDRLPLMLQDEVHHLRRQLLFLKTCQDGKLEDELGAALLS